MTETVKLPALGESVSEATITRWLKLPGEAIALGEALVEVATDKVDTEVVSEFDGVVAEILIAEGTTVDVGEAIAILQVSTNATDSDREPELESYAVAVPAPVAEATIPAVMPELPTSSTRPPRHDGAPYRTLYVRRIARELGIDLSTVRGTGANGRIRKSDVQGPPSYSGTRRPDGGKPTTMSIDLDLAREFDQDTLVSRVIAGTRAALSTSPTLAANGLNPTVEIGGESGFSVSIAEQNGYHSAVPVVRPQEVAALSVGAVRLVPRVASVAGTDAIIVGRVITVTLAVDTGAVNAADAQRFLGALKEHLQQA